MGAEQDVGRGRLSSLLRPLVPRLESEVLPLLQSEFYVILECQFVSAICSDLIVWIKVKYYITRLTGLWFKQYEGGNILSGKSPLTLPHVCRGQGEEHRQEGGEEGGERRRGERGGAHH